MTAPVRGVGFDLERLFAPRSIAIVGASLRSGIATTVRDNIARVGGSQPCYFVNPKYREVDGTRCYPDLAALPEVPDTVVLAVNPLRAAQFTREAADAGVRTVVIPGGGVVEGGEAAARMQAEVREIGISTGTSILGPKTPMARHSSACGLISSHIPCTSSSGSVASAPITSATSRARSPRNPLICQKYSQAV